MGMKYMETVRGEIWIRAEIKLREIARTEEATAEETLHFPDKSVEHILCAFIYSSFI